MTTPPRLAAWLLAHRLPAAEQEPILGDLAERFQEICLTDGAGAARRYYWSSALGLSLARWPESRLEPSRSGEGWLPGIGRDLRHALRIFRRAPLFSALVVLTFAIGLGATAAIFSVLNPVLLQGAPYPDAERVLVIMGKEKDGGPSRTGYLTFRDLQRETRSLSQVATMSNWTPVLSGPDDAERLTGQRVTQQFFSLLGVAPALGRDFRAEEDQSATRNVAILSYGLWQRRFGGDSGIVGKTISLSDRSVTVVGVMPRSFESVLAPQAEVWAPLGYAETDPWACRDCQHLQMIGRLADGVTATAAGAELDRISAGMVAAHPTEYAATGFLPTPLNEFLTQGILPALLATAGAVALLLLISCVNVASLFLGRTARRSGEFAVRTALGADAGQIVRQVVAEAVVLALGGGALAVLLAIAALRGLVSLAPAGLPRLDQVRVNLEVLGVTLLLALAAGLLAGLVPAMAARRPNFGRLIRQGGRTIAGAGQRLRSALVVAEVALAVILLAGAGLLVRSMGQLLAVEPGFQPEGLVTLELEPFGGKYREKLPIDAFYQEVIERVGAVPGVTSVGATSQLPLSGDYDGWGIHLESRPNDNPAEDPSAFRYGVTPGYLDAMGIPLLRGRKLASSDGAGSPPVLLISNSMARALFPGEDPLGQRIRIGGTDDPWRTIVGITGDVHQVSLETAGEFQFYLPEPQVPYAETRMVLVVRGSGEVAALVPQIRAAIREVDSRVPIATVATMTEHLHNRTATARFALAVFQAFGGVALLLAALGLYGVLATGVTERFREIGIRSALGATRSTLLGGVVRRALVLTGLGLGIGLGGALLVTGLLQSLLFGVSPTDPVTFSVVVLLLPVVALVAAGLPAWRAAGVDPAVVLREE